MSRVPTCEIKRPGEEWHPDDGGPLPVGTLTRPIDRGPNVKWVTLKVAEPVVDADGNLHAQYDIAEE